MKRVFLDTNFIIDYLVRPEYGVVAAQVLQKASAQNYKFVVSFLTVANFAYINRKMPAGMRNELIRSITGAFEVAPNTVMHLNDATNLNACDYEDAIQYLTALSANCGCIISRNRKDFSFSKIPVYTPTEFLELL